MKQKVLTKKLKVLLNLNKKSTILKPIDVICVICDNAINKWWN
ncbi:hypothetical protein [Spiroplasma gladiatoris]|nr:hypothetical protein [Spiroplasma gladiatoris]